MIANEERYRPNPFVEVTPFLIITRNYYRSASLSLRLGNVLHFFGIYQPFPLSAISLTMVAVQYLCWFLLKVHKIENFFYSDFGICLISLLFMSKY